MLDALLAERGCPPLPGPLGSPTSRAAMLDVLSRQVYGVTPPPPAEVHVRVLTEETVGAPSGPVRHEHAELTFATPAGDFTFPFDLLLPQADQPLPVVVHPAFEPYPALRGASPELLARHGVGLALFHYEAVTSDTAATDGLATLLPGESPRWGAIGVWAYAASRVLDHLLTRSDVDQDRISVLGHSRLGKTALWAAAQDDRFAAAVSNDSGCSGAALSRGTTGETTTDITQRFPYWFTPSYPAWAGREAELPYDQHFLLAALAPRVLHVASAMDDAWADPVSEYLGALAAAPAWTGDPADDRAFVHPDRLPVVGDDLGAGPIGYHLRAGGHALTAEDWDRALIHLGRALGRSS